MKGQDAEAVILWLQCLGEVVWQGCVVQWIGKPSVAGGLGRESTEAEVRAIFTFRF